MPYFVSRPCSRRYPEASECLLDMDPHIYKNGEEYIYFRGASNEVTMKLWMRPSLAGVKLSKGVSPVYPYYLLVNKCSWHYGEEDINRLRGEAIADNGVKCRRLDFIEIAALGWLILKVDRVCLVLCDRWWRRRYWRRFLWLRTSMG